MTPQHLNPTTPGPLPPRSAGEGQGGGPKPLRHASTGAIIRLVGRHPLGALGVRASPSRRAATHDRAAPATWLLRDTLNSWPL